MLKWWQRRPETNVRKHRSPSDVQRLSRHPWGWNTSGVDTRGGRFMDDRALIWQDCAGGSGAWRHVSRSKYRGGNLWQAHYFISNWFLICWTFWWYKMSLSLGSITQYVKSYCSALKHPTFTCNEQINLNVFFILRSHVRTGEGKLSSSYWACCSVQWSVWSGTTTALSILRLWFFTELMLSSRFMNTLSGGVVGKTEYKASSKDCVFAKWTQVKLNLIRI